MKKKTINNKNVLEKIDRYFDAQIPPMSDRLKSVPLVKKKDESEDVYLSKKRPNKKLVYIAVSVLLLVTLCGAAVLASLLPISDDTTVFVNIDINPSVQLITDASGRVKSVAARNEAASLLLQKLNLKGKSIGESVDEIVAAAIRLGYIDLTGNPKFPNALMISTASEKENLANKIKEKAAQNAIEYVKSKGIKCAVLTGFASKENLVSLLEDYGVGADVSMSVAELNFMLEEFHARLGPMSAEVLSKLSSDEKFRYWQETQMLQWQNNLIRGEISRTKQTIAAVARSLKAENDTDLEVLLTLTDTFAMKKYKTSFVRILQTGNVPLEIENADLELIETGKRYYEKVASRLDPASLACYSDLKAWEQTLKLALSRLVSSTAEKTDEICFMYDELTYYAPLGESAFVLCSELKRVSADWESCTGEEAMHYYSLNLTATDVKITAQYAKLVADFKGEISESEYESWNNAQIALYADPDVFKSMYREYNAFKMKLYFPLS